MKRRILLALLACAIPAAMAADHSPPATPAPIQYHGAGIINRVEPTLGQVNISHGAVPAAGWQPMTRDLRVKPRHLVNGLVPGMRIKFQLTAVDPMTYVITALAPLE